MNRNINEKADVQTFPLPAESQKVSCEQVCVQSTPLLYFDSYSKQTYLKPQFAGYFTRLNLLLQVLKNKQNEAWTLEQKESFQNFLDYSSLYIEEWIFGGLVKTWEEFQEWLNDVRNQTNPIGLKLYEERLESYQKEVKDLYMLKKVDDKSNRKAFLSKNNRKISLATDDQEDNEKLKRKTSAQTSASKRSQTKTKYIEKSLKTKPKYVQKAEKITEFEVNQKVDTPEKISQTPKPQENQKTLQSQIALQQKTTQKIEQVKNVQPTSPVNKTKKAIFVEKPAHLCVTKKHINVKALGKPTKLKYVAKTQETILAQKSKEKVSEELMSEDQ